MDNEIGYCDYNCELCSLDFTTRRELEEHTWSILHNTNLSRKRGRDCKHPCSLCKQEFTRLSEFKSHLLGDSHREKIHRWQKDHQQEWSPDEKQLESPDKEKLQKSEKHKPQIPEKQELERKPQEKEEGELSDWAADDLTGVNTFENYLSDQSGEAIMNDYRRGHQHPYEGYPGQCPPRGIPSILDSHLPPAGREEEYGFHYQEEEMRRGRGPNPPCPNDDPAYANDGRPAGNGFNNERDFGEPSYIPGYARMNHSRNYDRQDESYYGIREGNRMKFRDDGRPYPNDGQINSYHGGRVEGSMMMSKDDVKPSANDSFSDDYPSGRRRKVFDERQLGDLRDRISGRGNTSSQSSHEGRQRIRGVVGSSFTTSRENDERAYSRRNRRKGPGNRSQWESSTHKQDPGRRKTSQDNKDKDIKEGSQAKTSPSSESLNGKSARKSKPRKVTRAEEHHKDVPISKKSSSKNVEVNSHSPKGKELEGENSGGNKTVVREKDQTKFGPSSQQAKGNSNGESTMDSRDSTNKKPQARKGDWGAKQNNASTNKTGSTSSVIGDTPSPAIEARGLSSPPIERKLSSPGNNGVSPISSERDSSSAPASSPGSKYETLLSVNGNSYSSKKEDSSLMTKVSATLALKESFIPTAMKESSLQTKGTFSASANPQSFIATNGKSSLPTETSLPALAKEATIEKTVENPAPKALDESLKSIKNDKEVVTGVHEKVISVAFLDKQTNQSQDFKEAGKKCAISSSSASGQKEFDVNVKEQSQSLSSLSKDNKGYSTYCSDETSNLLAENTKEKTADKQGRNSSKEREQAIKSSTISAVASLPWEKREEQLRALLGIKKEPKDLEDQNNTIAFPVSRLTSSLREKNVTISTSSTPTVNNLTSSPSKSNSSRGVPVFSQLTSCQSQCSIVHIDGTSCGAVAENKYCPYHQRVFKSEEGNANQQNLGARGNQCKGSEGESDSLRTIVDGRQIGAQIFRPITPPSDPPQRLGLGGSKIREEQDNRSEGGRNAPKRCRENDLNSEVPYTEFRVSYDPVGTIDLSSTVQGVPRNFFPRESLASGRSRPNIDSSDRVPTKPLSITLEAATTSDTGIDLSGTVPNLEELLALHGSSADEFDGPKVDLYKTGTKHGQSWNQQRLKADTRPTVDRSLTAPYHGATVVGSSNEANIDLNETIALPRSPRAPLDSLKHGSIEHKKAQAAEGDRLGHPSGASMLPNSNADTEMIDLNLSTKLLGVPHSVVSPFNTRPAREISKSPSELSTKSSQLATRIHSPSPKRSNVCTSPLSRGQSPSPTISLPNYSLDLSRFNLPPAVRKALADRYSSKKVSSAASGPTVESSDGRRSHPLFTDSTRTDGQIDKGKKLSPLPARLRSRGQRSVSLDSPLVRKENLHGEGSSRAVFLERGNFYDKNRFVNRPSSEKSQGREKTSLISLSHNLGGLFKSSGVMIPSTNVSSLSTQDATAKEDTNELYRRGLIDLSSTSYLEEIPGTSVNQGRSLAATRPTIDSSQSPLRPSVLQDRGLIDLNSSMELGIREAASPGTLSVTKRKRVNSTEGSESSSSSSSEQLMKRLKQEQAIAQENTAATYRPGINVQELLTIEREEQNQLQNLHAVQSRLKSVRSHIQKLCMELDSLSSEEQRITLKMGELRNQRLSILENACCERQVPTTRTETVTRELRVSTADDEKSLSFSSESGKSDTSDPSYSAWQSKCQDNVSVAKDKIPRGPYNKEAEDEVYGNNNTSRAKDKEPLQHESNFSNGAIGTATNFVSKGEIQRQNLPHEKVIQKVYVAKQVESSKQEINFIEGAKNISSGAQLSVNAASSEPAEETPDMLERSDTNSFGIDRGHGAVRGSGNLGNAPVHDSHGENNDNEAREGLMKKVKLFYRPAKAPFRKKSCSDVSISKTLEANRKKIQSVRENMERWKFQEESEGLRESNDNETKKQTSQARLQSAEYYHNSNVVEEECLPRKMLVQEKSASRKTTKELKKSSLFRSSKKSPKEVQKNRLNKTQLREKEEANKTDAVPVKRRKMEDTSCNKSSTFPMGKKPLTKIKNQVVSAAAHTTTTDLEGPGSEERGHMEDEIPTRDVDSQSGNMKYSRPSHLKIPSSTVESLKKSLQNSKDGRSRGALATKFPGHTGAVCGLKVHNGYLFTCSTDKTTRSFNIQSGECVKMYQGHHLAVNCIEVSADKDRLFTGSNDQTVRSYNIKSGNCTHRFTFDGRVMCLQAAFDLLFVGLSTGVVASIDLVNNICQERLHCHEPRGVSCLATATEGQRKLLCSGSFDSTIAIRDCKTGLLIRTLCDHSMTVLCIQVVENILYSGSADMKVQAHNLNTGELLRSFDGHPMSVSGLQIIGNVLVTSCLDKLIRCYDLTSADLLQVYGGQMDMIFSIHVNNGRIYSGARDGTVVAVKLDLRIYHACKWRDCDLNFGVVTHLKNHLREHHVMEEGSVEACHWAECGHEFSADDDISTVLKHVLGHVVSRTARKSAN